MRMPRIGTNGTRGTRNGRGARGSMRRITSTAPQTITKANRVPMLVSSARRRKGSSEARVATTHAVTIVPFHGVP
jgi:hypothetical protein